jgi:hypothetical protein
MTNTKEQLEELSRLVNDGQLLRKWLPREVWEQAEAEYVQLRLELLEAQKQLESVLESDKNRFRQDVQAVFMQAFSEGKVMSPISEGNLTAYPRFSKVVPYSVAEVHSIFSNHGLKDPPIKSSIDVKSLDTEQRKLYKSLEKIVGVSCTIRSSSGSEDGED